MIPFEINLRKEKWLFVSIYKLPSQNNQYFLDILGDLLEFYSQDYDIKVILGDFNLEPSNPSAASFMKQYFVYSDFEKKSIDTLDKHAPKKIETFRGNQKPHINKILRKAIMKRSQLKNKANKTRNTTDILTIKSKETMQ